MNRISLSAEEVSAVKGLLSEVRSQYASVEDGEFLRHSHLIAHELPRRLRAFLCDFKSSESSGACLVSGYPVDDRSLGRTPPHWKDRNGVSPALEAELLLVLYSSLLGDVIGWATQQNGHIVHDVLPIREDENSQISSGSLQTIWWHNEDAFHPYRGDYVGLMCLRNPDRVPTTFASVEMLRLDERVVKTLFEPHFRIHPDDSHAQRSKDDWPAPAAATQEGPRVEACEHIRQLDERPPKVPVMFGHPQSPYLRLDPYYMTPPDEEHARLALDSLIRAVDECLSEVVLQPGDVLFVDNYRAVHGRKPFRARYDGTDRWLKRVNVTRDLRKSRDARESSSARVIF